MQNLVILFLLLLLGPVHAQPDVEGEESDTKVTAIATTPRGKAAIISYNNGVLPLFEGDRISEVTVTEIDQDGVEFEGEEGRWRIDFLSTADEFDEFLSEPAPEFNPQAMVKLQPFENADLVFVLFELARQAGAGYLFAEDVEGAVNCQAQSLTINQALQLVLPPTLNKAEMRGSFQPPIRARLLRRLRGLSV